jgi:hypothetical protein
MVFQRVEQMLEDTCPRHGRKALILLSFLMGLVLGTALLNMQSGLQQEDPAVSLAALPRTMQPARLQQPAARQFLQPVAASRSELLKGEVGRREALGAFAAVLSAAFAQSPALAARSENNANTPKTGEYQRNWGTTASSNGRRNPYTDIKVPEVGARPTELADSQYKIERKSYYVPPKTPADTSYELLSNGLKAVITEMEPGRGLKR